MRRGFKWRYVCGVAVILAVASLVVVAFSLLGTTDKEEIYLTEALDVRRGWRYELLIGGEVRAYEPEYLKLGVAVPEGAQAIRITRTMTEDIPAAELEWSSQQEGIEVFLDGELFYSDFGQLEREADGFVRPDQAQWDRLWSMRGEDWQYVSMSLPEDYPGRELSMITYFPEGQEGLRVQYPILTNDDAKMAPMAVFAVRYNIAMTIYAILAIALAGVFLLDSWNNRNPDGKTLLLCLYFLMLFLNEAYNSSAGYYSVLTSRLDLRVLRPVYMTPLYLYIALRLGPRWRLPLCGMIAAWAVYEVVQEGVILYQNDPGTASMTGPGALLVLLTVGAAFCAETVQQRREGRLEWKKMLRYGLMGAAVAALYMSDRFRAWGGAGSYLREGVWTSLLMGNYWAVVTPITDIISYLTVATMLVEVVRRTMLNRRTVAVLRERERRTMESYERMLAAENATNALHHEMRHHMTALSALLQSGDIQRANSYVDAVAGDLEQLPTGRYSQNVLVNVIAGSYLDRAKEQKIRVEHRLNVPPELNIADEDLSVLLSNMLQNALEACERMEPGRERYIKVEMRLREKFLFIQCVNSAPDEAGKEGTRPRHGYGLAAMRRIAEKYDSVLVVEHTRVEFSVMSDLCLRER